MYYSERKTGCRFIEVIFHGYRSLIIENDIIRTMILVDKGTDIISYIDKKSDTEFIWTNPMGLSCLEKRRYANMDMDCFSDNYVGGIFEILPNLGDECNFESKHFPSHSEVSYLPWDYQVLEDTEDRLIFCFTVKLSKYPFYLKKKLTVNNHSAALCFDEEVENLGMKALPYQWAYHPCIGAPFLNEDCVFELPFSEVVSMSSQGTMNTVLKSFNCEGNGFGAIRNTKTATGIGFAWDTNIFSKCGLWMQSGYDCGHHHFGGSYVTSIMPKSTETFCLDKAFEKGETAVLPANGIHKTWFTITAFEKSTPVTKIEKNGEVR